MNDEISKFIETLDNYKPTAVQQILQDINSQAVYEAKFVRGDSSEK